MNVVCLPEDHPLGPHLLPLAQKAARRLSLDRYLARLVLCLDDIAPDERVWLSFSSDTRDTGEDGQRRRQLTIYLHPSQLLKDRPATSGLLPTAAVWEMHEAPREVGLPATTDFSRRKVERFLYHQFLSVHDLCDGSIDPAGIPAGLVDGFQEIWAVTVDGRLRRARLPGYSAAERRRRFSRIFAAHGVLLPEHWRIFHALWAVEEAVQGEMLRWLRVLPRRRFRGSA